MNPKRLAKGWVAVHEERLTAYQAAVDALRWLVDEEVSWNGDVPYLNYGDQIDPDKWTAARSALARLSRGEEGPA